MDPLAGTILLNGAPSQLDRWRPALDPALAPVDGRSFPELLDFALQYARLIRYYNLDDEADGDWVEFFAADPTMILAAVVTIDLAAAEAEYRRRAKETRQAHGCERKFELLRSTFAAILDLARQVNQWLEALDLAPQDDASRALRQQIAEAVRDSLGAQVRRLEAYDRGARPPSALGAAIGLDYSGFLPVWDAGPVGPDSAIYRGATKSRRIDHALPFLDPIFYALLDAVEGFKAFAAVNVPATLNGGDHKPQIALYIAFARLFERAQATINTLSSRYVDFYDRRVLREAPAPGIPDSVYLTFALAPEEGVLSAAVPQGTLFPAGEDAQGQTILYALDKALAVTAARIAELRTLRALPGPAGPLGPPRQILASTIAVDPETNVQAGGVGGNGWGTFGEDAAGTVDGELTALATWGFALAAQELLLQGGERTVTVAIAYEVQGAPPSPEVLRLVLERRLRLFASTAAGWFRIEGHSVDLDGDAPARMTLRFTLPPAAPPLAGLTPPEPGGEPVEAPEGVEISADPEVLATNPAPGVPTLKAYLDQQPLDVITPAGPVQIDPLPVVYGIETRGFDLRVDVRGLSDLMLENTDGAIDPGTPFTVFGGLPVVGSFLQLRSVELFSKVPESLRVVVDWFNLPQNSTGFAGYYKDYVIGLDGRRSPLPLFDNRVFTGGFSVRDPGTWTVAETSPPGEPVFLFRTQNHCGDAEPGPAAPLCPATDFDTFEIQPRPGGPPRYYDPAASALRLELTAPPYAFGNDLYAQNVLAAVLADLPDPAACRNECLAACRPLAAAARSIAACLRRCAGAGDPESCLAGCLTACGEEILAAAVDGLLRCLTACVDGLDPQVLRGLQEGIATCRSLPAAQQPECLRLCLQEVRGLLVPAESGCVGCIGACLSRFALLLEAAAWIFDCIGSACDSPPASLFECARACREKLTAAHAECVETCMAACLSPKKELRYPNEPYLPQATAVRVDYTAAADGPMFFHLLPFGGYDQPALRPPGQGTPLLPRLDHPGTLYVGFSQLLPPQTLSLLVQMAGDREPVAGLPEVDWSVLSADRWARLAPSDLLADGTGGLEHSGILALSLPAFGPAGATVLPSGFQWLRATVVRDPGLFPRTIALTPHASIATWVPGSSDGAHLFKPLPAGTITGSVQDLPFIGALSQPLESFGGRPPETRPAFEIRLGERLRHKDRAVLAWDDERLVLERFPTIWKVQALPARDLTGGGIPGSVLVVVVPGPDSQQALDPTVPRAPADQLDRIKAYLQGLASPFVRFQVINPVYVRITVHAVVQFTRDSDPGANVERLNDDLVSYLSPWFYDAARVAKQGRYASQDEIAEFIETRPYVEALECIDFSYDPDPAALDWCFLTSAEEHVINAHKSREVAP